MLKCRNIVIDTQYFLDKRFDFEHPEFKALGELIREGLVFVYMTDITEREIRKKINDELTVAFNKLGTSELRYLSAIPLYRRFKETYDLDKTIGIFVQQFLDFIEKFEVTILKSKEVNILSIFEDYCQMRPPFNLKKDKKSEFPDAIALSAIKYWAEKNNERAYLLSKDRDWILFADNSYICLNDERYFECISDLPAFTDLILRTEDELKDIVKFADSLIEERSKEIANLLIEKIKKSSFNAQSNSVDADVVYVRILEAEISFKQALSCDRDSAIFSVEFECDAIFGYDVVDMSNGVWDREDRIYRGGYEGVIYQKQPLQVTAELEISYEGGIVSNFSITNLRLEDSYDVDFDVELAETVNIQEWNLNIPVKVCGVIDGKITEDGGGHMVFSNFAEAKDTFPVLDIWKSSNEFTAAYGAHTFNKQLRFDTWILNKLLSD